MGRDILPPLPFEIVTEDFLSLWLELELDKWLNRQWKWI